MLPDKDNQSQTYAGSEYDSSLEADPAPQEAAPIAAPERRVWSPFRLNKTAIVITAVTLIVISLIGGGSLLFTSNKSNPNSQKDQSANFKVSNLPVQGVTTNNLQVGQADHLAVNGQLRVSNTVVLAPTATPTTPVKGQIYFDKNSNQPYFYNGSSFVSLKPNAPAPFPQHVSAIGGASGAIDLGSGLLVSAGRLTLDASILQAGGARVSSVQGLTGDVSFTAGTGINLNGTTIANGGVLSVAGTANQISVSTATGDLTLSLPQDIAVTSVPTFAGLTLNGAGTALSVTNDVSIGGNGTIGGDLTIQGSTGLTLANGNLTLSSVTAAVNTNILRGLGGAADLTIDAGPNGIIFSTQSGANTFMLPTSGGSGQIICTSGISCAAGGGQALLLEPNGVQTANQNRTAIFVNKASGTGNLLQLQAAGSDALLIDNAGNTTIGNTLSVNTIAPTAAFTVGSAGQQFTLQGSQNSAIAITGGGFTTALGFAIGSGATAPTGNVTYLLQNDNTIAPGTYNICTSAGNCAINSPITGGGTIGRIAKFTNAGTIGDSLLSESGSTITLGGSVLAQAAANSTTAFQIQNAAGSSVVNVDTVNNTLTVNTANNTPTYGAELITIPDFTNPAWSSPNWTTTSTTATHITGNTNAITSNQFTATAGIIYQITFTVTGNPTAGSTITPFIGAVTGKPISGNAANVVQEIVAAGTTTPAIQFIPTSNWNGTISNVSVKQITPTVSGLTINDSTAAFPIEVRTTGVFGNTFVGVTAGRLITTGFANTGFGSGTLQFTTTGTENTALGFNSLEFNTTGKQNTSIGRAALQGNISGNNNTALGYFAGLGNTTGSNNTFIGSGADLAASMGGFLQNSTVIGTHATVAQNDSIVLGCVAGVNACTTSSKIGIDNAAPSYTLDVAGDARFKNVTDSTTAFQIQNAAGSSNLFVADTTTNHIGIGKAPGALYTLDVNGSASFSGDVLLGSTSSNTTSVSGKLNAGTYIGANSGDNTGWFQKGFTAGTGGVSANDLVVLINDGGANRVVDTTTPRDPAVWGVATGTAASGVGVGIVIAGNFRVNVDTAAVNIGDQLVASSTAGKATVDNSATTGILGVALSSKAGGSTGQVNVAVRPHGGQSTPVFRNTTDSTTAFQIQNAAGTSNLFVADTTNTAIGIGKAPSAGTTLDVNGTIRTNSGLQLNGGVSSGNISHNQTVGTNGVTANDVVILANDSGNNRVMDTITARDTRVYGVASATQPAGSQQSIVTNGNTNVAVDTGTVNIGDQLVVSSFTDGTHPNGGYATVDNSATTGIIGYATSFKGNGAVGTVGVMVRPVGGQSTPVFRSAANSTTAFQVQNSTGSAVLLVDTLNLKVALGSATKLTFGGDTNLYRSAANTLKTDSNLVAAGSALFQNTTDTTTAFQIQNAAGSSNLFIADTTNSKIGIGTAPLSTGARLQVNGDISFNSLGAQGATPLCLNASNIIGTCGSNAAVVTLQQAYNASADPELVLDSTRGALTVRDAATPLGANLLEVQNNAGTTNYLSVSASNFTFKSGSNSNNAFLVQNAGGTSIFKVDTTNSYVDVGGSPNVAKLSVASNISTVDLFSVTDTTGGGLGTVAFRVADEGAASFRNRTDSGAAFQIQNAGGSTILNVATNASLADPGSPTLSTSATGGTVAAGTYWYKIAAVNANGKTVPIATTPASVTTTGTTSSNTVSWTAVTGATGYAIYRSTTAAAIGPYAACTVVLAPATSYVDSSINNCNGGSVSLPTSDTTGGVLSVNGPIQMGGLNVLQTPGISNLFVGQSGNAALTGYNNIGVGNRVLLSVTSGTFNVGLGYTALSGNTTGGANVALGPSTLFANSTGSNNAAVGSASLSSNTSGDNNVAVGYLALQGNTTASSNVGLGVSALRLNTTGQSNTAVGAGAGITTVVANANTTGSQNTFIGNYAGPGTATQLQNATAIGTYATVSQNDSLVLGCVSGVNNCTANTKVGIDNATPSYTLDVAGDVNTTGVYRINGTNINTAGTLSNVAYLNGNQTFSGYNTFKPTTDSTTAFQIQNAAGTSNLFVADTTNSRIGIGVAAPTQTLDVAGTIQASANVFTGANIRLTNNSATGGHLEKTVPVGTSTVNVNDVVVLTDFSGTAKVTDTSTPRDPNVYGVSISTYTPGQSANVAISGNATVNADSAIVNIGDQLVTSNTPGAVTVDNSATTGILGYATTFKGSGAGTVGVRLQVHGGQSAPVFRNVTDSTTAFQIQNAAGTSNLFVADTTNTRIGIGTSTPGYRLQVAGGNAAITADSTGALQVKNAADNTYTLDVDTINQRVGIGVASPTATLDVRGNALFKNQSDSTTAFQIQNASGLIILNVDTANKIVQVTQNAIAANFGLSINTTNTQAGSVSHDIMAGVGGVTVGDVVIIDSTGNAVDTTTPRDPRIYGVAGRTAANGVQFGVNIAGNAAVNADTGAVNVGDQLVTSSTSGKVTVDNNATTGILGYATSSKAGGSAGTVGVRLQVHSGQSTPVFRNTADSTTAFQIQNAAGTSNLFVADTTNGRIGIGTASPISRFNVVGGNTTLQNSSTSALLVTDGTVNTLSVDTVNTRIGIGTASPAATLNVISPVGNNSVPTLKVQAAAGQSPDIFIAATSGGAAVFRVQSDGTTKVQSSTDSPTAFQIQNQAGNSNLFVADTQNTKIGIGMTPSAIGATLQITGDLQTSNNINASGSLKTATFLQLNNQATNSGYIGKNVVAGSGGVSINDVVVLDGSSQAVETTIPRDSRVYGVATNTFGAGTPVVVAISGDYTVKADATSKAISVGDQLVTSAASGRVVSDNSATTGILGIALTSLASGTGTVDVSIRPVNGQYSPTFRNATDSTTAFQIQNANNTTTLLNADTTTGTITVNQLQIGSAGVITGVSGSGGTLSTASSFKSGNNITARNGGGAEQVFIGTVTTGKGGLIIGTDTNLYRDSGGVLSTDGALTVKGAGGLTVGVAGSTIGQISLANNTNSNLVVLQGSAPTGTGNASIVIPSIPGGTSDTVCLLTLGNCTGANGGSGNGNYIFNQTTQQTGANFNIDGSGTIAGKLTVGASNLLVADSVNNKVGIGQTPLSTGATLQLSGNMVIQGADPAAVSQIVYGPSGQTATSIAEWRTYGSGFPLVQIQKSGALVGYGTIVAIQNQPTGSSALVAKAIAGQVSDIFQVQDTSRPVFSVKANGAVLSQNTTDSATAFQIQNAAGTSTLFNADTAANGGNLVTNPSFEVNANGWAPLGSATISRTTSQAYIGVASAQVDTTAAAGGGIKYQYDFAPSTQYTVSGYVRITSGTFNTLDVGRSDDGTTPTACATAQAVFNNGWTRFSCSFTTGASITTGSSYIFFRQTDATARTFYLDAVQLIASGTLTPYTVGNISLNGVINSPVTFRSSSDSTTAFQIQNAAGTSNLFVANTIIGRIGIGTANPSDRLEIVPSFDGGGITLNGNSTTPLSAGLTFKDSGTNRGSLGLAEAANRFSSDAVAGDIVLRAVTGTLRVLVGSGASQLRIAQGGAITLQNTTDSTAAFQIQNAAGTTTVLGVDTTNARVSIGNADTYLFRDGTNVLRTSGQLTVDGSLVNFGAFTGNGTFTLQNFTNSTTAFRILNSAGTTTVLSADTTGTGAVSIGAGGGLTVGVAGSVAGKVSLANSSNSNLVVLQGNAPSGSGNVTISIPTIAGGTSDTVCLVTLGNCSGTNGGSGNTNYIFNQSSLQTSANFNIDGNGSLGGNLTVKGAALFQPSSGNDSATAFQIKQSTTGGGASLLVADTTNLKVGVGAAPSASGAMLQVAAGLSLGTAGSVNGAITLANSTNSNLVVLQAGAPTGTGNVTINLPALTSNSTDTICLVSLANCSGTNGGAGNTNYIFNQTTQQTSANFNIDGSGVIGGNFTNNGAALFKGSSNSPTAFQIQNTSNTSLFTADTSNMKIDVLGDIYSKGLTWTGRSAAAANNWWDVTYGNGLFVAVAQSGTGNRVMTSSDGVNWTARSSAADNNWAAITYGNGLFVAVSDTGTGNRVMTSPDGISWTIRTTPADNDWDGVTYGNGLFVAVADSGTGNNVMTSPDGANWTLRTSGVINKGWQTVAYGNGKFVATAVSGSSRVMTSPDGVNWTTQTPYADYNWYGLTYGNGLFVAVASTGTGDRVMTSPDGVTWTGRSSAADNTWRSVTYGNGLFVAVADSGTGNRVMTSPDGINWTVRKSSDDSGWLGVAYGNGVFAAVAFNGAGNRVMTSGKAENNVVANSTAYQGGITLHGNSLFQSDTNSASTFQLQDSSGTAALTVSTNNLATGANAANAVLTVAKDSGTSRSINAAGSINASGADYAEWIPWSGDKPPRGSIVSYGGSNYVVSSKDTAAFVGNDKFTDTDSILVTFAGQVPVLVTGPVAQGDILVNNGDGTARAVNPADATVGELLGKIAIAQEANSDPAVKLVNASVGTTSDSMAAALQNQSATFADLTVNGTADLAGLNVSGPATLTGLTVTGNASFTGTVTVKTLKVGDLEIAGHLITAGDTPTTQIQAAVGQRDPALPNGGHDSSVTIDGNDTSGTITIKTGDVGLSAGDLAKIVFSKNYDKTPRIIISGQDGRSAASFVYPSAKSADDFMLRMDNPPAANSTYTFDYFIAE